ncbi:MAG: hypothetical protein FJW63_06680 [Actinobacteria bacterium]|nr:hypothetical protein [Actinomycetota bacterium]
MRRKRISMDKIREIIRLKSELDLGCRKIAKALNISKTVVNYYVQEFRATGLSYQDIADLTDSELSELLYKNKRGCQKYKKLEAMFPYFARDLKRKGVTLKLLWDEHIADNPDGYSYPRLTWHVTIH